MPYISITFVGEAGPRPELMSDITEVVVNRLGVPRETVSVVVHPVPATDWSVGGVPISENIGR